MYRAASRFTISGTTSNFNSDYLYLSYLDSAYNFKVDSARVNNSKFAFSGYLKEPSLAVIKADKSISDPKHSQFDDFFLEASNMHIELNSGNFKSSVYSGSSCDTVYRRNRMLNKSMVQKLKSLENKFDNEKNERLKIKLEDAYLLQLKTLNENELKFIEQNNKSFTSLYLLQFVYENIPYSRFKRLYTNFSIDIRNSNLGKKIETLLKKSETLDVGKKAPHFSQLDLRGNLTSLSAFKGKYVLIDFWASWCGPCRRAFNSLKKVYYNYEQQGLTIILVSSDEDETEWRKAIAMDSLELWYNILDTPGTNPIGESYQINVLPTKFLIDTSGNIVGKYSAWDEEKLYRTLKAIYNREAEIMKRNRQQ